VAVKTEIGNRRDLLGLCTERWYDH